jgi:hypothetical protein
MPRYHFHLRVRGMMHRDLEGTDLPDVAAAREHAGAVADEMMRHSGAGTRHWSIRAEDADGKGQFDLFFADIDQRLAAYSPQMRLLVCETARRLGALTDLMSVARATQTESRVLLARARGKPQLVYARGE